MDDIHFLERLERVSMVHMDLALSLYRNPELVRFLLHEAAPPDRFERVAIALDHSGQPPWVIVDRQGNFITCLGAGMVPGGCWTLSRASCARCRANTSASRPRWTRARRSRRTSARSTGSGRPC